MKIYVKTIAILLIPTTLLISSQTNVLAAESNTCRSLTCENPSVDPLFGQLQFRMEPVCEVVRDWKVSVVTAIVGQVLRINLIYTLVPTLVCR
jgi:hypothetical protein